MVRPRRASTQASCKHLASLQSANERSAAHACKPNVEVDCGWERIIFGQTFDDADVLINCLSRKEPGKRSIALYVQDAHGVVARAPEAVFLDPSHVYRWALATYRPPPMRPRRFTVRALTSLHEAEEVEDLCRKAQMILPTPAFIWTQHRSLVLSYFVAIDYATKKVVGTATGIDHRAAFDDAENGASLWEFVVDPQYPIPGVPEALAHGAAEYCFAQGRTFIDFSVMFGNTGAAAFYERLGCRRTSAFALKAKTPYNEALYMKAPPELRLNAYASILIKEAKRRGIKVEILDVDAAYFALSFEGHRIVCRESLSELTTAIAMSRCDDKALTRRLLARAGLKVPAQINAGPAENNEKFLRQYGRIVVKPAHGEQGAGIAVDVRTSHGLQSAIERARAIDNSVVLEQFVEGQDLRVIVIDYRVVAAAIRLPPILIGNGKDTVQALIKHWNRRRAAITSGESRIPLDEETQRCVRDGGYAMHDRLPGGCELKVRKTANLHTGGTIHDVTHRLSLTICQAAVKAARMIEIPVVGIDFLVPAVQGERYVIIEANERPGLANHEPQPTAERFIDLLFPQTARASESSCSVRRHYNLRKVQQQPL